MYPYLCVLLSGVSIPIIRTEITSPLLSFTLMVSPSTTLSSLYSLIEYPCCSAVCCTTVSFFTSFFPLNFSITSQQASFVVVSELLRLQSKKSNFTVFSISAGSFASAISWVAKVCSTSAFVSAGVAAIANDESNQTPNIPSKNCFVVPIIHKQKYKKPPIAVPKLAQKEKVAISGFLLFRVYRLGTVLLFFLEQKSRTRKKSDSRQIFLYTIFTFQVFH
nr:MAG TPA: hypothetical protein [Bacteriophage sp.]